MLTFDKSSDQFWDALFLGEMV